MIKSKIRQLKNREVKNVQTMGRYELLYKISKRQVPYLPSPLPRAMSPDFTIMHTNEMF